ncbi:MAG: hypothetical protein NTW07_09565, partial [candidate division Zixibacteria bacterium]|nr:hypothetical protein [candidate division Zixibacteria bacterium]
MRVFVVVVTAALLGSSLFYCTDDKPLQPSQPDPNNNPPVVRTPAQLTAQETGLLSSCNKFGLNLFREIVAKTASTENVFISPLSVSYALGLCYNGANGATRDSIAATLQLAGLSVEELNQAYHDLTEILVYADPDVDFRVGNSFWSR